MKIFYYRKHFIRLILVMIVLWIAESGSEAQAYKGVYDWTYVKLDYKRQEKVQLLKDFCNRIHRLARQAAIDEFVVACFEINRQYTEAKEQGPVPKNLSKKVDELGDTFNRYYIENYIAFYDLIFINKKGKIFLTLRKESQLHPDLFHGDLAQSSLALCLRQNPQEESFVDYHYWKPSGEPAAFFVEPVRKDGIHTGWIVLQLAINKINTLLAWTEDLGETGETFLVNQEGSMLTESNFEGSSTVLKKRLDDRNIQSKFADKKGHRMVIDYRGCRALTSFEVVHFLGTRWLVVAKVDRDEIITNHYVEHRRYYADKLLLYLDEHPLHSLQNAEALRSTKTLRVDMDEFLKASEGESLHTFGVSTCTALLATYPGKFAYLAHISPKDRLYGAKDANLLGQMIKKIKSYDIYRCERRKVIYVLVATHLETILPSIDKLIEEGFLLSQIRMIYNPKAKSASMSYDYIKNTLNVSWRLDKLRVNQNIHGMEDSLNIGEIIRMIMLREERSVNNEGKTYSQYDAKNIGS